MPFLSSKTSCNNDEGKSFNRLERTNSAYPGASAIYRYDRIDRGKLFNLARLGRREDCFLGKKRFNLTVAPKADIALRAMVRTKA